MLSKRSCKRIQLNLSIALGFNQVFFIVSEGSIQLTKMVGTRFFMFSRNVFKFLGIWGDVGEPKTLRAICIKYVVVVVLGVVIPSISVTEVMAAARKGDVPLSFSKALFGFGYLVCHHKLAAAALNSKKIYSCIAELERMASKFKDMTEFDSSLKTYKNMATIGTVANNICGVFFVVAPLVQRELPYNPQIEQLDFSKSPYFEVMYAYQAVATILISNAMIAYDALFCGLMRLSAGIMASINREIKEMNVSAPESEKTLKDIFKKLVEISSLIDEISDTFSFTTMTSILYNCNLMALGLFMVSFLPFTDLICITMISVIIVETFQLWIYCYFGQVIVDEKELLQIELYCTQWYNGSKNFKSMLLMAFLIAQNDCYVKAGRILPLSMMTFSEVLKKAYAFYAFMKEAK